MMVTCNTNAHNPFYVYDYLLFQFIHVKRRRLQPDVTATSLASFAVLMATEAVELPTEPIFT